MEKRYLGDAVYAEIENGMVKVTTSDGETDTNTIYLEHEVFDALLKFRQDAIEHYQRQRDLAKEPS